MIAVEQLTHRFGAREVLRGVSFQVAPGEVVGLVGPNGAGKSTVLRALVTLLLPDAGQVQIAGHDLRRDPVAVRRALGFIPERASVYPELTVFEYLAFFAAVARLPRPLAQTRIAEALALGGLTARRDQLASELSKGLRQRLALEGALLAAPKVLVLDEPTDGLDPPSREALYQRMRDFARAGGAVLLTSQVLDELERVADRTLILVDGQLDARGAAPLRFAVRVRGDLEVARALCAGLPEIASAVIEDQRLILSPRPPATDVAAAAAALIGGGFALLELRPRDGELRQRFQEALK